MTADARRLAEIEGLRNEAFTATDNRRAELAANELLARADEAASSPEDRLLRAIEAGPKPKSAVTPVKTSATTPADCRGSSRGVRRLLRKHGQDPDMQGLVFLLTDQYLRLGKEVRETALFDLRVRRELAEVQDAELRVMSNEEMRKALERMNRRAGFRKVSLLRNAVRDRLAAAGLDPGLVDSLLPAVPEHEPRMDATTLMRQADRRIEADLDGARRDVDEALACVEGDPDNGPGEDKGPEAEGPSDGGGG